VSGILVLMVCVMLFNGVLNRLERYVLRWRQRERAADRPKRNSRRCHHRGRSPRGGEPLVREDPVQRRDQS